jgi:AraC-like DNA-binding protein
MKIYIKNMACESCKVVVKEVMEALEIPYKKIEMGEVETVQEVSDADKKRLNIKIRKAGLELLEKRKGIIIEKMKKEMVNYVYHSDEKSMVNFSELLSKKLNYSYGYLSNLFSEVEANTIERYIISLKTERIKQLIIMEELTLTQISYKMHYSSIAHLSAQFKRETGLTPSHFKKIKEKRRISIQDI